MRRALLILSSVLSLHMSAGPLSTVEGLVTMEGNALPGCTIFLESPALTRTVVSDEEGRYRFAGVAEGEYEIHFELEGTEPAQQGAVIGGEVTTVPVQDLRPASFEEIVLGCTLLCEDEAPADRFDRPPCGDFHLHNALIESARQGDASSVALLQSRYATADTYSERHRLGGALLGKTGNDAEIWNELVSDAEIALRFPHAGGGHTPEFLRHCEELGVDPYSYWSMAEDALTIASRDTRSHALLLRALATDDDALVYAAINGLAGQHDLESLPLIEDAILRFDVSRTTLVYELSRFQDERADAVAMRLLEDEADRQLYREARVKVAQSSDESLNLNPQ